MPAEIETAMVANTAAWWDRAGEFVHDGLIPKEEILPLSKTKWHVDLVPVEFMGRETGYNLVVRDSDDAVFACVTDRFTPLQNEELVEYMSLLVDQSDLMFESGLALKGGRVVAYCARRPDHVTIAGEQYVNYLTGANWHDGTRQASLFFSNVRTVCQNTLNAGMNQARNIFKFRHVGDIRGRMTEAREQLEMGFSYQEELVKIGEQLAARKMSVSEFDAFLKATAPDPKKTRDQDAYKSALAATTRTRDGIRQVYRDTPDLENIRGTEWGALQAVTAYNDHLRNFQNPDNRFETVVLSRNETTERAFSYLVKPLGYAGVAGRAFRDS